MRALDRFLVDCGAFHVTENATWSLDRTFTSGKRIFSRVIVLISEGEPYSFSVNNGGCSTADLRCWVRVGDERRDLPERRADDDERFLYFYTLLNYESQKASRSLFAVGPLRPLAAPTYGLRPSDARHLS